MLRDIDALPGERMLWLEVVRLGTTLDAIQAMTMVPIEIARITPLAFPLWASFTQANVSSEKWADRVRRMALQLEQAAAREPALRN